MDEFYYQQYVTSDQIRQHLTNAFDNNPDELYRLSRVPDLKSIRPFFNLNRCIRRQAYTIYCLMFIYKSHCTIVH